MQNLELISFPEKEAPEEGPSAPPKPDMVEFARNPITLRFKDGMVEEGFAIEVARTRKGVFLATFSFDLLLLIIRLAISALSEQGWAELGRVSAQALLNLAALYTALAVIHRWSQRSGAAASKAETLAVALIALQLCLLLRSPSPHSWIFVAFFLVCSSAILRVRWLVGAAALALPVAVAVGQNLRLGPPGCAAGAAGCFAAPGSPAAAWVLAVAARVRSAGPLPLPTVLHLCVAWAAGALMGYLADDSRRQSFACHRLALAAAGTELAQVRARVAAERELARAQALAQAKSLLVDRERAANEAKSEFISMLCHEIRTPLNGCLASAEMLLQTELDEEQKDLAHTVRVSGAILLSTVSNFLDFFKLEAGKRLDVVRAPLELGPLVSDVHRIIEAMVAAGGGMELLAPDLSGAPRSALGDAPRLCGILLNLYMNAAKFTKRGSIGVKVKVVGQGYRPLPGTHRRSGSGDAVAAASPSPGASAEDLNNMVPPREGGRRWDAGEGGNNEGQARHDSAESLPTAAAADPGGVQMSIRDEGDGWLSTCSAPQLPPFAAAATSGDSPAAAPAPADDGEVRWISFEVHDTGVGVGPRSLSALFHDYVQGDAAEMDKPRTRSGTGLGLAICSKQVAVLGGVIGALSKPGVGSVFWFKVPMAVPREAAAEAEAEEAGRVFRSVSEPLPPVPRRLESSWARSASSTALPEMVAAPAAAPAPATPDAGLAGLRVLVVEDNLINRKVACKVLQSMGMVCEVAVNGQEGVEVVAADQAAAQPRLDVVLIDMCMPVMDGVTAARHMRDMGCRLPLVAMTANALDRDREACLDAGMDGFLSKPVLREDLAACLAEVVARRPRARWAGADT